MRVANWNPNVMDQSFEDVAVERLLIAAEVVAENARRRCPVGNISRPMYQTGRYAGQPWTARDAGQLKDSIRVTQKHSKSGKPLWRRRNIRVYAGHFLAYYASIVEFYTPFMRTALAVSDAAMRQAIESGIGPAPSSAGSHINVAKRVRELEATRKPMKTKSGLPHLFDSPEWKAFVSRGRKPK